MNTQCRSIIGTNVTVIGYLYDDSPDDQVVRYLLLPGSDYAELNEDMIMTSVMLFFPEDEQVRLPEACVGRMVTVSGTVGIFSGIPAIRPVSYIGGSEQACYFRPST